MFLGDEKHEANVPTTSVIVTFVRGYWPVLVTISRTMYDCSAIWTAQLGELYVEKVAPLFVLTSNRQRMLIGFTITRFVSVATRLAVELLVICPTAEAVTIFVEVTQ